MLEFPPLARAVEDVRTSAETFLAVHMADQLVGCVGMAHDAEYAGMTIASLTVAPAFQRRGIATAPLSEVLQQRGSGALTVQTGTTNVPAQRLCERHGFLAAMLDVTMGPPLCATLAAGEFAPTLRLNVSFQRATTVGILVGRGRVVRRDRDVCFLDATLFQGEHQVASTTATAMVRRLPLQGPTSFVNQIANSMTPGPRGAVCPSSAARAGHHAVVARSMLR